MWIATLPTRYRPGLPAGADSCLVLLPKQNIWCCIASCTAVLPAAMLLAAFLNTLLSTYGLFFNHMLLPAISDHAVVLYSACRQIERPQQLLNFDNGGYANRELIKYYNLSADAQMTGFQNCIGVR
jgi:hypothetical protein